MSSLSLLGSMKLLYVLWESQTGALGLGGEINIGEASRSHRCSGNDWCVWSLQKTPQKPQTAPDTFSSTVRMAAASPTGGNVTERMTVGTGPMRRIVEVRALGTGSARSPTSPGQTDSSAWLQTPTLSRVPGSILTVWLFEMPSSSVMSPLCFFHILHVCTGACGGQGSASAVGFPSLFTSVYETVSFW